MSDERQRYGKECEELAEEFLKKEGYKILEKNYRNKIGEIDIIAMDGETLVFVEVKARKTLNFGEPHESVTLKKRRKISRVALLYLKIKKRLNSKARFDVVSITSTGESPKIRVIKNAFEAVS